MERLLLSSCSNKTVLSRAMGMVCTSNTVSVWISVSYCPWLTHYSMCQRWSSLGLFLAMLWCSTVGLVPAVEAPCGKPVSVCHANPKANEAHFSTETTHLLNSFCFQGCSNRKNKKKYIYIYNALWIKDVIVSRPLLVCPNNEYLQKVILFQRCKNLPFHQSKGRAAVNSGWHIFIITRKGLE